MVERRELINVFRQIGIMMQAGVDFLRITHVLRAQTENPRLADLYNALDHDLTMGMSLADAMARQPDIFSPFAVSLVRQTEMRSDMAEMSQDLAAAFLRVADYLQQETTSARAHGNYDATGNAPAPIPPNSKPVETTVDPTAVEPSQPLAAPHLAQAQVDQSYTLTAEIERWSATLRLIALRALLMLSLLFTALAALEGSVALSWLPARWLGAALWGVSALFSGGATFWLWQHGTGRNTSPSLGIRDAPPPPALADESSSEISAPPAAVPSATLFPAVSPAIEDDAIDEGEAGDEIEEPDVATPSESAASVAWGNWADLKRADKPSTLPLWAREEEAAGLPPLPTDSAPPTSHSSEEADYD